MTYAVHLDGAPIDDGAYANAHEAVLHATRLKQTDPDYLVTIVLWA